MYLYNRVYWNRSNRTSRIDTEEQDKVFEEKLRAYRTVFVPWNILNTSFGSSDTQSATVHKYRMHLGDVALHEFLGQRYEHVGKFWEDADRQSKWHEKDKMTTYMANELWAIG